MSRVYNAYEVNYRRDGERRNVLVNSRNEAVQLRDDLVRNKRKFLGFRPVQLVELKPGYRMLQVQS
jgi:hypothetical protein